MAHHKSSQGQWSSRWAFFFAAAASAVGLGNIWKFPYITGENGGAAFVLVYIGCILIMGLPLMMAEIALGRRAGRNPIQATRAVAVESCRSPRWQIIGILGVLTGFLVLSYYSVIAGWSLDYILKGLMGAFNGANSEEISTLFNDFIGNPWSLSFWHTVTILSVIFTTASGVQKGIERVVYFMFPAMLIILLGLVVYATQTGAFMQGLTFLFAPDFSKLTMDSVLLAMGQAFFSLSLAQGAMLAYGAYLPVRVSIAKTAILIALADTFIALLAGVAIFPIVFANDLPITAGPSLIFETLPIAFGKMPFGQVFSVLFFIMLFFAAFTSAIALIEGVVAWANERLNISRRMAAFAAGGLIWLLGFIAVFSFNIGSDVTVFGKNGFEFIDYLTADIMMPLSGFLVAIFVGWMIDKDVIKKELGIKNPLYHKAWFFTVRYLSPIAIAAVGIDLLFF